MLNLRIAIALQIARNSIGGTRSASDRSDMIMCFCAESQICSHTVKGAGSLAAAVELDILEEHTAVI